MSLNRLPFWHFFHSIEKELSYERWISKYKILLDAFEGNLIEYDDEWNGFKKFCRALYLQNYADLKRFDELLDRAIEKEKAFMLEYVRQMERGGAEQKTREEETKASKTKDLEENALAAKTKKKEDNRPDMSRSNKGDYMPEPGDASESRSYYYQPPDIKLKKEEGGVADDGDGEQVPQEDIGYLMTDEYFSVTRRQMVKGWQFLRYQESSGFTDEIDITATVKRIAKEGLFTTPAYRHGFRNREDTLILFADCRGSMMPFHALTDRLIETARGEGGHPRAPVYYFQNYPTGYVFSNVNFSNPLKVKEALVKANRNSTIAVVISDGGAARGNTDPVRTEERARMTSVFLDTLGESCAHVIWLNPMPEHRWKGTAAERISRHVYKMKPITDNEGYSFQDMLRTILRHNKD